MTGALSLGVAPQPTRTAAGATDVPLRFQVADRTLFSVRRRLIPVSFDFMTLVEDTDPPLAELDAGADGYIFRSLPAAKLAKIEARAGDFAVYVRSTYPRYYASLAGSFDDYLGKFSGKTRSGLKRKSKKFAELSGGTLDAREFRTPAEIEAFHGLARQVSQLTYQERLLDAGLPDTPAYRERMMKLAAADQARGYMLFLDGRPVSYLYTPINKGCAVYAYLGYDPTLAAHSPGTVLQLFAMERLFGEGQFRFFDFTEGEGQHKRQFATGHFDCADVILLKPTAANRGLIAAHRSFHRGIERLRDAAERAGVKARLKKLLRGG